VIELKTPREIEKMRVTGRFVADVLTELSAFAEVGRNVLELEQRARQRIEERGATSCY
jgi:methionyl aminopeptidase